MRRRAPRPIGTWSSADGADRGRARRRQDPVTDAVVVAWTGRGPRLPYLGPGTAAGWCIARAVRQAVGSGIAR